MPTWPAELGEQLLGITIQQRNPMLRTQMDAGSPKVRRRYTAISKEVSIPVVMTGAQYKLFESFYHTELQDGVLRFTWENPIDDTPELNFRFTEPPVFTLVSGGPADSRDWTAVLQLEILP